MAIKSSRGSVNQSGILEVEAGTVGNDTTLAPIRRLVEEAQASQAPVQRVADKAAKWYVHAALLLAALVWGVTGNVVPSITVLIVFCPCALVLATPTAIVAAILIMDERGTLGESTRPTRGRFCRVCRPGALTRRGVTGP